MHNFAVMRAQGIPSKTLVGATISLLDSQKFMIETDSYPIDLTDYTECRVLRADNVLFSFIETNENYYGGAHGMYSVAGYAYDVETGKELSLTDIVVDESKIRDLIAEKLDGGIWSCHWILSNA